MSYVISRANKSITNGKPDGPRVYVTGPHFGEDIWSSTYDPIEAAVFRTYHEAERVAASKVLRRSWVGTRVIPLAEARVLPR